MNIEESRYIRENFNRTLVEQYMYYYNLVLFYPCFRAEEGWVLFTHGPQGTAVITLMTAMLMVILKAYIQ